MELRDDVIRKSLFQLNRERVFYLKKCRWASLNLLPSIHQTLSPHPTHLADKFIFTVTRQTPLTAFCKERRVHMTQDPS